MVRLTMICGKRSVFIGMFPSQYRAEVVACALEWSGDWKPIYTKEALPAELEMIIFGTKSGGMLQGAM